MSEAVASDAVFPFTQFEFGFLLGPPDGRYLRRAGEGGEAERVVVLQTLAASRPRTGRRRRWRRVERAAAAAVPTARATLVGTKPFGSSEEAAAWLERVRRDESRAREEIQAAARELNLVLRAHRAAAADPYVREVASEQALAVRIGYGRGEEVAEGRFAEAYELPPAGGGRSRAERLDPQERLAAILAGRDRVLVCEELVLRARADVDAGRPREAALQARIALEALLAEFRGEPSDRSALSDLEADRDPIGAAANAALETDPPDALRRAVEEALDRMESAIRRHRSARL